jgi:hypothetical protein
MPFMDTAKVSGITADTFSSSYRKTLLRKAKK